MTWINGFCAANSVRITYAGFIATLMRDLPVLFLAGPTATGKTELAMRLADLLELILINVDAAHVFRGMDIGTSKLDPQLQSL